MASEAVQGVWFHVWLCHKLVILDDPFNSVLFVLVISVYYYSVRIQLLLTFQRGSSVGISQVSLLSMPILSM